MTPILAGSALLGLYEAIRGWQGLSDLHNKPEPKYEEVDAMKAARQQAELAARKGFSDAQKAQFQQGLAQAENTASRRALDVSGGNLARAVSGLAKIQNIGAQGEFAAKDALQMQRNIMYRDKFAQNLQDLEKANISRQWSNRIQAEQALGQGVSTGLGQIGGAINFAAMAGLGKDNKDNSKEMPDWMKFFMGKKSANATPFNPNNIPSATAPTYIEPLPSYLTEDYYK